MFHSRSVTIAAAPRLDWQRTVAWTEAVLAGDMAEIERVFVENGSAPPDIVWNPDPDRLDADPLRFLLSHWRSLAQRPALPHVRQIDPLDLLPALGFVMLIDAIDGGRDFGYRLYGSTLV